MKFTLFSLEHIIAMHDDVIDENEIQGLASDKSLDGALSRVFYRIKYGLIQDVFDLAATYCVVIARGHVFHDANKRTAFKAMVICFRLHGYIPDFAAQEVGDIVIEVAQGKIDEVELASWLRQNVR